MSVARLEDLKISGSPPHPLLDNSVICLDICDKVKFVVATDLWIEMLSSNSLDGALSYDGAVHPLVLAKTHCILNFDQQLLYTSFFADFGPLDLGLTVSFCNEMGKALDKASKMGKLDGVVYYSSRNPQRVSIDIVLLATYLLVTKGYTAERAYQPFYDNLTLQKYVVPFRDAAFSINTYPITVIDCIKGVYRAILNKHFDYASFDLFRFKELSQLQNGDISWIIPNKYIAFSGPTTVRREVSAGVRTLAPVHFFPYFLSYVVTLTHPDIRKSMCPCSNAWVSRWWCASTASAMIRMSSRQTESSTSTSTTRSEIVLLFYRDYHNSLAIHNISCFVLFRMVPTRRTRYCRVSYKSVKPRKAS